MHKVDEQKAMRINNKPLISVIVPIYNAEQYLKRCIDSILEQSYDNLEIILVDDGSKDKSKDIIISYQKKDARIKPIYHDSNKGLFQARITGTSVASGDYIAFVDSDDYISVDWFRMLENRATSLNAEITVGEWCFDTEGEKTYLNLDPFRIKDYDLNEDEVMKAFMEQAGKCFSWTVIWNKLYKKTLWDTCVQRFIDFSEKHGHMLMWEDIAFSSALWANARHVTNVHGALYYYYKHSNASTSISDDIARNIKYINDSSAAMVFLLESINNKERNNEEYLKYYQEWMDEAVSIVYHDLIRNHVQRKQYEGLIRKAFDYDKNIQPVNVFFYEMQTPVHESFSWLENIKKQILSPNTKYVSFDVFDTLIERPFLQPVDLFEIISEEFNRTTSAYINFTELRITAEKECREKLYLSNRSTEEITLDQIYEQLEQLALFSNNSLVKLKNREIELELEYCTGRSIGKELYQLAKDAEKSIIICSDMYLPREVIEDILDNNEYSNYEKIYLSSELLLTKATGNLYKYAQNDLKCKNSEYILHIGDNWASDVEQARKQGWNAAHVAKASELLKNANPGVYTGEAYEKIFEHNNRNDDYFETVKSFSLLRNTLGLVANRFFGNPFVSFNQNSDFNGNPAYIGYWTLGSHLLALSNWIINVSNQRDIPTIHFVARDGFLVKKAVDILKDSHVKTNYLRLSRKALLLADVNSVGDIFSIYNKLDYRTLSPAKLAEYLQPIIQKDIYGNLSIIMQEHGIVFDRNFAIRSECDKCLNVYINCVLDESLLEEYHHDLFDYFSTIIHPGDYIFDIGYSGRSEAALSNILGFSVGSLYIHTNSEIAYKRQQHYACPNECFYSNKPCITGVMREHFIMELGPSTIGYEKIDMQMQPVLEKYSVDYCSAFITEIVQEAALDFVKDYCYMFKKYFFYNYLPQDALSAAFEYLLHYSKLFDRLAFSSLTFEDDLYAGKINALEYWNNAIHDFGLDCANIYYPSASDLDDIYLDGYYVKLIKYMNHLFPKGTSRREFIKCIAGFFIK